MTNKQNLTRDVALGVAVFFALVAGTFIVVSNEACYRSNFCYEISSVFRIYNYAIELFIVSTAVGLAAIYSRRKRSNPMRWFVLSVFWVPLTFIVSILSVATNGWIPTSISSDFVVFALSVVYFILSIFLLRDQTVDHQT